MFTAFILINATDNLFAQIKDKAKFETYVRLGDSQFQLNYIQIAKEFYEKAYSYFSEDAHVNYRLAECCRLQYQYNAAIHYYKKAGDLDMRSFPLSYFYYGLMLKSEGSYETAITQFEYFIEKTKNFPPEQFKEKKAFFQRTLIEMEGCYWALEQLFEYKCQLLPQPVNSIFNDFAAIPLDNDSNVLLLTNRSNSKNPTKSADYTDFKIFQKTQTEWQTAKFENNFAAINDQYNEGSGCFNHNKSEFYFTRCNTDIYCKIYITRLINGKWSEPEPLNEKINAPFSDNKQPAINKTGDTLYFVSNRNGGFGQNDIWFSIKNDTGEWSNPINIGNQLNTPFNEVTPFWEPNENILFFSSDGHKGFGGLDIFLAKKDAYHNFSITNLSTPFNSNADDIYFIINNKCGYLTSNRKNGIGAFDIYSFDNMFTRNQQNDYHKKLADLSQSLSKLKYDIEITKPEIPSELINIDLQNIYDRILSAKFAALVHDVVLVLFEPDYNDYNKLTIEDLSIIDLLYMSMEVNTLPHQIDSIRKTDKIKYQNLASDEEQFVNELAEKYIITTGGAAFIKMSKTELGQYANLSLEDKKTIDRLIAYKIKFLIDEKNKSLTDNTFIDNLGVKTMIDSLSLQTSLTFDEYERIMSLKLASFIHNTTVKPIESDYKLFEKLTIDEKSLLEMDFSSRTYDLNEKILQQYRIADQKQYSNFSEKEKTDIDKIAEIQINNSDSPNYIELNTELKDFYSGLNLPQKRKIDRLIAYRIRKYTLDSISEKNFLITDFLPDADTNYYNKTVQDKFNRLISNRLAAYIYDIHFQYTEPDYLIEQSLNSIDKDILNKLFTTYCTQFTPEVIYEVINNNKLIYEKLDSIEKHLIDSIAIQYNKTAFHAPFVKLNDRISNYYRNLSIIEKKRIDRLIAYKLAELKKARKEAIIQYTDIKNSELGIFDSTNVGKLFSPSELTNIEKILSFKIAGYIYRLLVPFIESDSKIYNSMTIENLSILDMMFATKTFSLEDPQVIVSIRQADAKQYKNLTRIERDFINRLVDMFLIAEDTIQHIALLPADSMLYANMQIEQKYKTDRLVLYRLKELLTPQITVTNTEDLIISDQLFIRELSKSGKIISPTESNLYENILSFQIANEIHNTKTELFKPYRDSIILLTKAQKSILEAIYDVKKALLTNKEILDSLISLDETRYRKLSSVEKQFVDSIVKLNLLNKNAGFIIPNEKEINFFENLSIKDKYKLNRIIAMIYKKYILADQTNELLAQRIQKDELEINQIKKTEIISSKEISIYNRVLPFKLACFIYNIELPLINFDQTLYNTLTLEEKSILDMMFLLKSTAINKKEIIDSIKQSDLIIYENLIDEEKNFINRIVDSYITPDNLDIQISLGANDEKKYKSLNIEEKFKTDRLFISLLSQIAEENQKIKHIEEKIKNDFLINNLNEISKTGILSEKDINNYERIISFRLALFIYGLNIPLLAPDYNLNENLSLEDQSILEMLLHSRKSILKDTVEINLMRKHDRYNYKLVLPSEREFIDKTVDAIINCDEKLNYVKIDSSQTKIYEEFQLNQKFKIDRLICNKIYEIINTTTSEQKNINNDGFSINIKELANNNRILTMTDYENYEKILSIQMATFIYNKNIPFIESDFRIQQNLTRDDLSIIDLMLLSRTHNLTKTNISDIQKADKLIYNSLQDFEKEIIKNITENFKNQRNAKFIELSEIDADFYKNLSIIQKNKFDRLIAANIGYDYQTNFDTTYKTSETLPFELKLNTLNCKQINIFAKINNTEYTKFDNINLYLNNSEGITIQSSVTNNKGEFYFNTIKGLQDYHIIIQKPNNATGIYYLNNISIQCLDSINYQNQIIKYIPDTIIKVINTNIYQINPIEIIYFDYNKSDISEQGKNTLDNIVRYCTEKQTTKLIVKSFTDYLGTEQYNKSLSTKRANTVFNYLTSNGISKNRITINTHGKQNPIAPNDTENGRKLNRRVELIIIE